MHKPRVGVLRGGPSSEYDISLMTGGAVLQNLDTELYNPVDLLIDKEGVWHLRGRATTIPQALAHVDVVFNAMHGAFGEDGTVQKILDSHSIPYTGSSALVSAICMNKLMAKRHLQSYAKDTGLKFARHKVLAAIEVHETDLSKLFDSFTPTVITKPLTGGSSVGVTVAYSLPEFREGVVRALTYGPRVFIEEYITGREATVGVVEHFREQDLYAMLPIEIIPPEGAGFFSREARYNGLAQEICPGNFSPETRQNLEQHALLAHKALGLRHYSRSDFIVAPDGIYFLEINTLPGLTPQSLVPRALKAVGSSLKEFISHLLGLATRKVY